MTDTHPAGVTIHVEAGDPVETGQTCPGCGFDSMVACVVVLSAGDAPPNPIVEWYCGREVCAETAGESDRD